MPKRRMTPARKAAIAKWQQAGARSRRKSNGSNRIAKWSPTELAQPRRQPKAIEQQLKHIEKLKREVGGFALDTTKPYSTGKTVRVYHYTTPERAAKILAEGFTRPTLRTHGTNTPYSNLSDASYMYGVLPQVKDKWSGYGKALVSVRVSHRFVKVDQSMGTYNPPPMRVAIANLQGRKFKRHK